MHERHRLIAQICDNGSKVEAYGKAQKGGDAEVQADRALKEMGAMLRAFDDAEGLGENLKKANDPPYGLSVMQDGSKEDLYFRDLTNKILHARCYEWSTDKARGPVVTCVGNEGERWVTAQLTIARLQQLCGTLG